MTPSPNTCPDAAVAAVRERLNTYRGQGGSADYVVQMWDLALQHLDTVDDEVPSTESCDAIPYLPRSVPIAAGDASDDPVFLDIGCLGGYGLFDVTHRRAGERCPWSRMVGMDVDSTSVRLAQELASVWAGELPVSFCCGSAEDVPLDDRSCSVVVARLLLPYVRIRETIAEIHRVLAPGGIVLFQLHTFRYYGQSLREHWRSPGLAAYYFRPILAGLVFDVSGRQMRHRWFAEAALREATLRRLCRQQGMLPVWQGGFKARPLIAFRKSV